MKKLIISSFAIEGAGIGLLAVALIEGISKNPAVYLAPCGGFLIVTGGLLFNKVLHLMRK